MFSIGHTDANRGHHLQLPKFPELNAILTNECSLWVFVFCQINSVVNPNI